MKALLLFCLIVTVVNANNSAKCNDGLCPTTLPPGPTIRCAQCVTDQCTPSMCNAATLLPYPGNCEKYCVCEVGGAIEMPCPPGLYFDQSLQQCVWPYQTSCSNNDPYPGCDGSATTTTTTPAPISTTELPECTTKPPCTTEPPQPMEQCPDCVNQYCTPDMCNQAKGVPYPNDCTKFCICDSTGAVQMTCPDGLHFNPAIGVCDWPVNAACIPNPYPNC